MQYWIRNKIKRFICFVSPSRRHSTNKIAFTNFFDFTNTSCFGLIYKCAIYRPASPLGRDTAYTCTFYNWSNNTNGVLITAQKKGKTGNINNGDGNGCARSRPASNSLRFGGTSFGNIVLQLIISCNNSTHEFININLISTVRFMKTYTFSGNVII